MRVSVLVCTYGARRWALEGAEATRSVTGAHEIVGLHLSDGTLAESRNLAAAGATGDWLLYELDPELSSDDLRHYGGSDSELTRQSGDLAVCAGRTAADCGYLFGREFGAPVSLTAVTPHASLPRRIAHVVAVRAAEEMRRVAAGRVVAGVADLGAWRERTVQVFFDPAMCANYARSTRAALCAVPKAAVSFGEPRSKPRPTIVWPSLLDFCPEALLRRLLEVTAKRVTPALPAAVVRLAVASRRVRLRTAVYVTFRHLAPL